MSDAARRFPTGLMSTCCIPWTAEFQLDEPVFRSSIRSALSGTPHLYVFGTAGEGYAVTAAQYRRIVGVFADEIRRGGADPMVGVIDLSLGTILERIQQARELGVRLFQISLPSWGAVSTAELHQFFDAVCGGFPDCRFLHYNLPRTKRLVTGREYGELARRHANLVATKNCGDSLSHIQSLIEDAPELTHFLSENGYVYGSLWGECGILVSFIMNWPRLHELYEAGRRRDVARLVAIQREIRIVIQTLFETVPDNRIDGSYDKLFEKMYHSEFPLRLLPPYIGSSDEEFEAFVKLLAQRLPDWIPGTHSTNGAVR
ncbi:MAG: dihydrodipicolinate synthase family protein [Planctomycetaceae bacterium]|jgi:dihydrodipicolinate synthase/N-acetylneuraminate lyase